VETAAAAGEVVPDDRVLQTQFRVEGANGAAFAVGADAVPVAEGDLEAVDEDPVRRPNSVAVQGDHVVRVVGLDPR
jgi:hypothetical protein